MANLSTFLFRALLRKARNLKKDSKNLWLQDAVKIDYESARHGGFVLQTEVKALQNKILGRVFPNELGNLVSLFPNRQLDGSGLENIIQYGFRRAINLPLSGAFDAVKALNEQKISSVCTTNDIRVTVQTYFTPDESTPEEDEFKYCYRITIENLGLKKVKILGRHWRFTHPTKGLITSVRKWGKGVVGLYPEINPEECFLYISSVNVSDNQGAIEGAFLVEDMTTNETFEVAISKCNYFAMVDGKLVKQATELNVV